MQTAWCDECSPVMMNTTKAEKQKRTMRRWYVWDNQVPLQNKVSYRGTSWWRRDGWNPLQVSHPRILSCQCDDYAGLKICPRLQRYIAYRRLAIMKSHAQTEYIRAKQHPGWLQNLDRAFPSPDGDSVSLAVIIWVFSRERWDVILSGR